MTVDPSTLTRNLSSNPSYAIEDHVYSSTGDEIQMIDAVGMVTSRVFDSLRRPIQKIDAAGTSSAAVWQYQYDAVGNLTTLTSPRTFAEEGTNGITTFTFIGIMGASSSSSATQ